VRVGVGKVIAVPPEVKLEVAVDVSLVAELYSYVRTYEFAVQSAYKVKLAVFP
jgi:hypothetical protein